MMQNHAAGVTDVGCEGKNTRGSNAPMSKKNHSSARERIDM